LGGVEARLGVGEVDGEGVLGREEKEEISRCWEGRLELSLWRLLCVGRGT